MAVVDGMTAERMLAIEGASITGGSVNNSGHLILSSQDGGSIDAGIITGPAGAKGDTGPTGPSGPIFPGTIMMYAGENAPAGWLICNGEAVSRTTYAALFNVVLDNYGLGNGTTTFNVPSMFQRFPRMDYGNLGDTGGDTSHIHTTPAHAHVLQGGSDPAAAHVSIQTGTAPNIFEERIGSVDQWNSTHQGDATTTAATSGASATVGAKVTGTTSVDGGGNSGANTDGGLPPYINVNFIIKY